MKTFKTDIHCHIRGSCDCASESLEQTVEKYARCGYTTIVTTNHFCASHLKSFFHGDYNAYVDAIFSGSEQLRRIAEGKLYIITSIELRLSSEYLILGITPKILKDRPDIFSLYDSDAYTYFKSCGCLMIQAHPMRFYSRIIHPDFLDGYEVLNSYPEIESYNDFAMAWAKQVGKGKIFTAGSDNHHYKYDPTAGILTDEPVKTSSDLLSVLQSGNYEIFG